MKLIKIIKNKYVMNQVKNACIPEFEPDAIMHYRIIFVGKVQKVGLRLEIEQLALRLQLTGWIRNLEDGTVEMDIQGMDNRIDFMIRFVDKLKRIQIVALHKETLETLGQEQNFTIL